jgi:hypothetical protein
VAVAPALERFSARSDLLLRTAQPKPFARSTTVAANAVEGKPQLQEAAQGSAESVQTIAGRTTRESTARTRVIACARSGGLTAAGAYATNYVPGKPPPHVDVTLAKVVGSCLKKAFPEQATAVHYLTDAITKSMLASSQQVSTTRATAQDYTDWLVYTASLYQEKSVRTSDTQTQATPSPVHKAVDDLLVILFRAHEGRVAVRHKEWALASANRTSVLRDLHALQVTTKLEHARKVLIAAMRTSLAADRRHAACGRCAAPVDHRATTYKKAFAREFNPYLRAAYGGGVDHTEF